MISKTTSNIVFTLFAIVFCFLLKKCYNDFVVFNEKYFKCEQICLDKGYTHHLIEKNVCSCSGIAVELPNLENKNDK